MIQQLFGQTLSHLGAVAARFVEAARVREMKAQGRDTTPAAVERSHFSRACFLLRRTSFAFDGDDAKPFAHKKSA
jgi:hypothetical protein